jgi:hypothetical protein
VVLRTPSVVNRFLELIHPGTIHFNATAIQAFCSPFLGFACFLVFLKNKQLRWQIKVRFFPSLIPRDDSGDRSFKVAEERVPLLPGINRGRNSVPEDVLGTETPSGTLQRQKSGSTRQRLANKNASYSQVFENQVVLVDDSLTESQRIPEEHKRASRTYIQSIPAYQPLKIFVGSWNLGNTQPSEDLTDWLPNDQYDIVAVGVQECKYSPKQGGGCKEAWCELVTNTLGSNYQRLAFVSLREIRLTVHARKQIVPYITNVQEAKEATGIANVLGNKGGVGESFQLFVVCYSSSDDLNARGDAQLPRHVFLLCELPPGCTSRDGGGPQS